MLNDCKATVSGYCVKYWATAGITAITGELDNTIGGTGRIMVRTNGYFQSYGDKEWDTTLVGAMAKAERLRTKRIASLKKQLKKVTEMEIKTP